MWIATVKSWSRRRSTCGMSERSYCAARAGRYAYQLGFAVCCLTAFLVALLGALGVMEHYLPLLYFLAAYLVFQYAVGLWIYRRLERKY